MTTKLKSFAALLLLATLNLQLSTAAAQGTAFTYQGRLNDGLNPVNGIYDFRFTIFDSLSAGTQQGDALINSTTAVSNGLFTATLDFYFGIFTGPDRWLEIAVRPWGDTGAFTTLAPRQKLTSSPYAIQSLNAATAGFASYAFQSQEAVTATVALSANAVSAANISGLIPLSQLPAGLVTNGAGGLNISGTFSGNAGGLSNMPVNSLALTTNFSLVAWGDNFFGETNVPAGLTNVAGVAVGERHSLVLKSEGTVVAWGYNDFGQTNVPVGLNNMMAVAAGRFHSLALKRDGTLVAWGYNGNGQTNVPAGLNNVAVITAGANHNLALKKDGTIVGWGINFDGEADVPAGLTNAAAIAAGEGHSLVLKSNGTLVAWGWNGNGQTNVPAGLNNVVGIAAGIRHNLALKSDGTVVAWGDNGNGQTNVPAGLTNVTAVAAGSIHSLALKSDGTVVAWGDNSIGQTNVPAGLTNVIVLAPGSSAFHVLVTCGPTHRSVALLDGDNTFNGNIQINGALVVSGGISGAGLTQLNASNISSGTLADVRLSANVPLLNAAQTFTGANNFANAANSFTGSGAGLTGLAAGNISSGTLADARLSSNVPLLNANQIFAGQNTFNNAANSFTGSGSGLTSLNAGNLTGSVPPAVLTSVPAGNLTGTVADARLSANVALRAGGNTFNGNQTINGQIRLDSSDGFSQSSSGNFAVDAPFIIGGRVMLLTNGNFGIGTNAPQQKLHVIGNILASGTITGTSDRNVKENFSAINSREVLNKVVALPIMRWNYIADEAQIHLGPMAQDFYAAFKVGLDDKHISMVDADGVALAAIQGLNQKVDELKNELKRRDAENAELKQRLEALEKIIRN